MEIKGYWTQKDIMRRWGGGRTYLWQLRRDGTGPQCTVIAGKILYPIEGVLRWEEERMCRPGSF
jgi:hypothetical protein